MNMSKKVAIIGAGVAGLASIKNALDAGLEPTAFEKSSWLGGIWYYTEDDERFVAPKATILNTSKHFACFSDFPINKEMPNYLTREDFQRYLESYAKEFDLTRTIRFNCEVLKVDKCDDYEDTGRWEVHSVQRNNDDGQDVVCVEIYDYVMVCSGIFAKPFLPPISGVDEFTGRKIHSISYKTFTPFEERRVLVVGMGNTAADIASELSRHAKQVYLSTRRGTYIMPRMDSNVVPTDFTLINRFIQGLPLSVFNFKFQRQLNSYHNLKTLSLEPDDSGRSNFLIVNDELPNRIATGTVKIKDEIARFMDKKVFFQDNTMLDNIDDVIFATGYNVDLPFLPKSVFDPDKDRCISGPKFYKAIFPPNLAHPSLAFIGFLRVRLRSPYAPNLEMQARWAVRILTGELALPSIDAMKREIAGGQSMLDEDGSTGCDSSLYVVPFTVVDYMDDIASLLGVKPNLWKLFFQDPVIAIKCLFGPCVPAQYRLMGPGMWSGARQVIDQVEESRLTPLATRKVKNHNGPGTSSWSLWISLVSLAIVIIALIVLY